MEADLAQKQVVLPVPKSCPSGDCKSTKFHQVVEESEHTDYQEIRVQEQAQSLSMGSLPQSMTVILTDDLADSCRPGGAALTLLMTNILFDTCPRAGLQISPYCPMCDWLQLSL